MFVLLRSRFIFDLLPMTHIPDLSMVYHLIYATNKIKIKILKIFSIFTINDLLKLIYLFIHKNKKY